MSSDGALELMRNVVLVAAKVSGPALGAALVVGIVVGVLQTATQVNEAAVSFVTKLVAVAAAVVVAGPWVLGVLVEYARSTIGAIAQIVQ